MDATATGTRGGALEEDRGGTVNERGLERARRGGGDRRGVVRRGGGGGGVEEGYQTRKSRKRQGGDGLGELKTRWESG